ncbi:MAG: aspartate aminotransferase family protein [Chloroflexi bacterium]|nr:aspartate aminotransferase family protein [Chloroflexota bacterium]
MNIIEVENRYTSGVYPKRPVAIIRGEGARLWDDQDRMYIDCTGGQGTANVGHGNLFVARAIYEQASRLISLTEIFYNDRRAELLQRLMGIAPPGLERAFLCNSGAEAVEGGLKFARLATGRTGIVAAMRSFHGRTMGALSTTWEPKYREPFLPLIPGVTHIPYNNLEKLEQAVTAETACVLLEIVQGEGGVRVGEPEFLLGAQEICRRKGAMLVIDEVQTGFGRTGKMFACEHYNLQPDMLLLAKSIAGGLPMGAILLGSRVGEIPLSSHGSTFGGNPLACAAALAAIQYIEDHDLPARAERLGAHALARLQLLNLPVIREVRGMGLILGIELRQKVTPYLQTLLEMGLLALPAGSNVLRLLPPLVIEEADLDRAIDLIAQVLAAEPVAVAE